MSGDADGNRSLTRHRARGKGRPTPEQAAGAHAGSKTAAQQGRKKKSSTPENGGIQRLAARQRIESLAKSAGRPCEAAVELAVTHQPRVHSEGKVKGSLDVLELRHVDHALALGAALLCAVCAVERAADAAHAGAERVVGLRRVL